MTDQSPTMSYVVNDTTANLEVKIWLDASDPVINERKEKWVANSWIKVVGHMRTFNNQKQ